MKKIIMLTALTSLLTIQGCLSVGNKNLKEKAVSVNGLVSIQNLDTGYNPVTKTFTPKLLVVIARGFWSSIPLDKDNVDYLFFLKESISSIWNSAAIDSKLILIFASSDKELMAKVVEKLSEELKDKDK